MSNNHAFAESTTGVAFCLTLSKRQCNTMLRLREHERQHGKPDVTGRTTEQCFADGPANINIVQTDNLNPLLLRGLVSWHIDSKGRHSGFQGLTKAGELVADMLAEAGLSIENTNTLSVLKRLGGRAA